MSAPGTIAEIRQSVLARRKALAAPELVKASEAICRRWVKAWESQGASSRSRLTVAFYRALPGELRIDFLERYFGDRGARICYPWVKDRSASLLEMVEAPPDGKRQWEKGAYGIDELMNHQGVVLPAEIHLILVPGVAFGHSGERIGMGAGYYDRYLVQSPQALRVALALDYQIYSSLPQKSWDQRVHWIMTETMEFRMQPKDSSR